MEEVFNDPAVLHAYTGGDVALEDTEIQVLDWLDGLEYPFSRYLPVEQLTHSTPILRVINFPDRNEPGIPLTEGLLWLVQHYSIPTALLEGEIRSVAHSSGSFDTADGYRCCWFNYLCKNITVTEVPGSGPIIAGPVTGLRNRHSDYTWIRSAFFLRWSLRGNTPEVTLICFGENLVIDRLHRLPYKAVRDGVVYDPLSLFVVVLHELSGWMDQTAWKLSRVFSTIESKRALGLHRDRESFTGLHNISKHIIYLQESSDAALETMRNLKEYHDTLSPSISDKEKAAIGATRGAITQVETEFRTVKLRLRSLDRRMQNVISLSFHLVTQEGNEFLRADSQTMATIAFVTLVFLPITTVSTIFGSQFFNTASDNSSIEVSKDFWIFWVISVPLTLAVLLGWSLWQRRALLGNITVWKQKLYSFVARSKPDIGGTKDEQLR